MIFGFALQKKFFSSEGGSASGELAHAYLFTGQEMIGKKTFAHELAKTIAHPTEIIMVQSDIDSVREAKHFLSLSPLNGTRKVAIIDNAHALGEEAQNALLKILEEPSASSLLILITAHPASLLSTITSRCQSIEFFPPSKKEFFEYLKPKKLSDAQQEFLYQFSNGSIGLLSQDFSNIKKYAEEYSAITTADINQKFVLAKKLADDEMLQQKVFSWMLYLRTKKMYKPLRPLLALYRTISQPQFNKQLALENFMLEL